MGKVFEFIDSTRETLWKEKRKEILALIDPETNKVYKHYVERSNCPICEIDDAVWVFEKEGFEFVKCRSCGLLHVNPQLKSDIAESFYKKSKMATNWIKLQQGAKEQDWNAQRKYLPALEKLNCLKPDRGRLLDVGCSIGQFLKLSTQFGWECEGIELNHDAAEFARNEYGLKVYEEKLEDLKLDKESYDIITLWGVLEHLTDPNNILDSIHKLLKKDGLLLLFVPNGNSLLVRVTREHNSTVSGRAHLWYFSPRTIGQILEKNGFRKEDEFSVLPQLHELSHFLQFNTLYKEPSMHCEEEFTLSDKEKKIMEQYIDRNKMGYKLITIAKKT